MHANDFLSWLYTYRLNPKPEDAIYAFTFIVTERLLRIPRTALAISGVVTGLCDRHPIEYESWRRSHNELLSRAYSISKSASAQRDALWGEYLVNRWLILGTDECAWEILNLAHGSNEAQRIGAQTAIDKICFTATPGTNSRGDLVGKTDFEDMRLQMLRLAREYSRMTPNERKLSFNKLPWTEETRTAQLMQTAGVRSLTIQ